MEHGAKNRAHEVMLSIYMWMTDVPQTRVKRDCPRDTATTLELRDPTGGQRTLAIATSWRGRAAPRSGSPIYPLFSLPPPSLP